MDAKTVPCPKSAFIGVFFIDGILSLVHNVATLRLTETHDLTATHSILVRITEVARCNHIVPAISSDLFLFMIRRARINRTL
jgi:hypothetical protein